MRFENVLLRNIPKNELVLGYDESEDFIIDIDKHNSIIITGETGTGKSILLDQIILELTNKYNSNELGIASIDTSGVELNYLENSPYSLFSSFNDLNKSVVVLSRILKEIDRRREILKENECLSVDEYNKTHDKKLPLILLAIDDDKSLLKMEDIDKMLKAIISAKNLNILLVFVTGNIYNKFFIEDDNLLADILISFDFTSKEDAEVINIDGSQDLELGKYKVRIDKIVKTYNTYIFDDDLIHSHFKQKNQLN